MTVDQIAVNITADKKAFKQNDGRQNDVDKMTVDQIAIEKMAVDKKGC